MTSILKKALISLAAAAIALPLSAGAAFSQTLIRDAEIERTLSRLTNPILDAAGLQRNAVDVFIVSDPNLNAFVFGGRNMVFNTGLLARIDRPEALMSVIAHETGHITGGHLTRRAVNAENLQGPATVGLLLALIAGAAAGSPELAIAGAAGSEAAARRSFLAYTRAEEASADQAGATYLERAGIDPAYALDVLRIFRGQEVFQAGNVDPYALTHPLSAERIALLQDRAASTTARGGRVSEDLAYWHLRMRAKLSAFLSRPNRTLSQLEEAEEPESEISRLRRAIALHLLPDPPAALAEIDELIALRPEDPFYWELKGQIYFESGRAAEAVEPYRKAVSLAPEEPLIRGGLGRALLAADGPGDADEALTELELANRGGGANPSILRDLALAHARAGDNARASLATAERYALQGASRDALIHARRALDQLPVGSPGWLRADDIRAVAERAIGAN
ncbi:MAG: M48 family metalloprotease [Pseudomonadota bacterium]